ncbi:hypothetical protein HMI55_003168 [Coelomomyces lativittatus]|nr:hypothetical protein HMI55_003168 [Coelomomyces lativittatus]
MLVFFSGAFIFCLKKNPKATVPQLFHQVARFGRYSFSDILATLNENPTFALHQLRQVGLEQHAFSLHLKSHTLHNAIKVHFPDQSLPVNKMTLVKVTLPRYGDFYKCPHVDCEKVFTGTYEDMRDHFAEHLEKQKKAFKIQNPDFHRKGREINRRNLSLYQRLHQHLEASPTTSLPPFINLSPPKVSTTTFEYTVTQLPVFHSADSSPKILYPYQGPRKPMLQGQPPELFSLLKVVHAVFGAAAFYPLRPVLRDTEIDELEDTSHEVIEFEDEDDDDETEIIDVVSVDNEVREEKKFKVIFI